MHTALTNTSIPLPRLLSGYNGCSVIYFLRAKTGQISWSDEVRCSSHLRSHVVSYLLYSLLSNWKRNASPKFFDTQVPSVCTEEIVFPRYNCYVFFCSAAQIQPFVKLLPLQNWQNFESFVQCLRS